MRTTTLISPPTPGLVRGLGLLAATSILIGDVIGTGVFLKARVMTCNVGAPATVIAVWVVAGLLSLAGALTYGEIASLLPRAGGEYVYIREAYGRLSGFLYGWTRFFVANTGGMAGLAAGFAIFFNIVSGGSVQAWAVTVPGGWSIGGLQAVALIAIAIVTLTNCAAVSVSGKLAIAFTMLKVVLVVGVAAVAAFFAQGTWAHFGLSAAGAECDGVAAAAQGGFAGFGAAMLGALWAYNGWNELTYVSEEVKDPHRNLPLAIIGGLGIVAVLYVLANIAYFYVLTPMEIAALPASASVATSAMTRVVGNAAANMMAGVMAASIFGTLMIQSLACARVPFAMARDGMFFPALARLSPRTRVPIRALAAQAVWASVLVLSGSYDTLTDYAIFAVVIFVALATASVFVFRRRYPDYRGYRTPGYPVVPALFLIVAAWLVVNTLMATPGRALAGLGLIACGLPFYWYWSRRLPAKEGASA